MIRAIARRQRYMKTCTVLAVVTLGIYVAGIATGRFRDVIFWLPLGAFNAVEDAWIIFCLWCKRQAAERRGVEAGRAPLG